MKTPISHLLLGTLLAVSGIHAVHAAKVGSTKAVAQSKNQLAAAAESALQQGLHAQLPPHISTLLGLTQEQICPVLQGILRASESVQGFDVTEKNHADIVIFVVDEKTNDQVFYLTSPAGALRKLLSVKQGVGHVVKPTDADVAAFEKEKKMWIEHLAAK